MSILPAVLGSSDRKTDNRRVALLKSLATNNRFYTLVPPESGIKNADTIEYFPDEMILGIAYPCLEDGLNDFAIIRSTFETLDQFPDDEELRVELMDIIEDAQSKLVRRLSELRDRIGSGQAHFLGTDLAEFKQYLVNLVTKGVPRKTLDSMMKLDVFESVATTEALLSGADAPDFIYLYEFLPENSLDVTSELRSRPFVSRIFEDVLDSVNQPGNYADKHVFDRNVFQKFIAVMFVNYATTDPVFYGTNKADYGVSADKDMDKTPLYLAVGRSLRDLEQARFEEQRRPEGTPDFEVGGGSRTVELPTLPIADQGLLKHMTPVCESARMLINLDHPRAREHGERILRSTHRLFLELKEMGIFSPAADSPVSPEFQD